MPFPSLGDLSDPGIEPGSPAFQADALTSEPPGKPILHYSSIKKKKLKVQKKDSVCGCAQEEAVKNKDRLKEIQEGFAAEYGG